MSKKRKQQKREEKRAKREAKKIERRDAKVEKKQRQQEQKNVRHGQQRAEKQVGAMPQKKRRQHYVWQHYLSSWTVDGQLWCQMAGRRFQSGTNGVANERDFYRLKELTPHDLEIVDALTIQKMEPSIRALNRNWIDMFHTIFELKKAFEASGLDSEALETQIDVAINNLEEDLHAHIESDAVPLLKRLVDGDEQALLDLETYQRFVTFIAFQYMRTPKRMKASVAAGSGVIDGFNIEAAWGLMRTIYATGLGAGLARGHKALRATFLTSAPGTEFVAGDQPAVNTRARGLAPGEEAKELELYYPLSPRRALLLDFDGKDGSPKVGRRTLTPDETAAYNRFIVEASDRQVFAAREHDLITATAAAKPAAQ